MGLNRPLTLIQAIAWQRPQSKPCLIKRGHSRSSVVNMISRFLNLSIIIFTDLQRIKCFLYKGGLVKFYRSSAPFQVHRDGDSDVGGTQARSSLSALGKGIRREREKNYKDTAPKEAVF